MLTTELTDSQIEDIFQKNPDWVAENCPVSLNLIHPKWIRDNRPDLMEKYFREWSDKIKLMRKCEFVSKENVPNNILEHLKNKE
jgi:hypothetical protein